MAEAKAKADAKKKADAKNKVILESQDAIYKRAVEKLRADMLTVQPAYRTGNLKLARSMFEELGDYLDAPEKVKECDALLGTVAESEAQMRYEAAAYRETRVRFPEEWEKLAEEFTALGDYRDSAERAKECTARVNGQKRKKKGCTVILLVLLAVLAAAVIAFFSTDLYPYTRAWVCMQAGQYTTAEKTFRDLPGFLDSDAYAEECMLLSLRKTKVGENVSFGDYKWKILSRENGVVTLIAADVGSSHPFYRAVFHNTQEPVTWADSDLRSWLNGEISETIFSAEERSRLLPWKGAASRNEEFGTAYPEETEDLLTILSVEEIGELGFEEALSSLGLDFWLRTPGETEDTAVYWDAGSHAPRLYGAPVTDGDMAVRPVIRVDCSSQDRD